jgi:ribosomal subunit interface protein
VLISVYTKIIVLLVVTAQKGVSMSKRIVFRHMDKSDAMEAYANDKLAKIEEFLANERSPVYIDLVFEPSKTREHHRIELRVKTPHYEKISDYEYTGIAFYDVLDRVIDVMYRELHEEKRKQHDHEKKVGRQDDPKRQWEEE